MKKLPILLLFVVIIFNIRAQVSINTDQSLPDSSAMLDIQSGNRGLLIPRISADARNVLPSPATGLLIYNTTTDRFNYFDGNFWNQLEATFFTPVTGSLRPGGGISINAATLTEPDSSAMLDINNPTRGLLIPGTTPDSIVSPATGLIIYNTSTNHLNYYNGIQWISLCAITTDVPGAEGTQAAIGVAIKADNSGAHPSAMLDVSASTRGILIPRLTDFQRDQILPTTGLVIYNTNTNSIEFFNGTAWYRLIPQLLFPPLSGIQSPDESSITWRWNAVAGASGYRWNSVNNYATAIDLDTCTAKTEQFLSCNTLYTRFVWAYNVCGNSLPQTLTQSTQACFQCGSVLTIHHNAGETAPVTKTVTYGTVTDIPGEPQKCWITSNLGSNRQALTADDSTEASAGWYWQFNRKQGYQHDGTSRIPSSTWLINPDDFPGWDPSNDPCSLELGPEWRIPTQTEWENVDVQGNWYDRLGPWNSGLKLHAAGYLDPNNGSLAERGAKGYNWSSSPSDAATILFDNGPMVNSTGTGYGGADESMLQEPVEFFGTKFNHAEYYRIADDFSVTGNPWAVTSIEIYGYQTNSTTASTFTAAFCRILNGIPGQPGTTVVWGDTITNRLSETSFTNIYRVAETGNNTRPIMKIVMNITGLVIPTGDYWIEFSALGSLTSGPWCPYVTLNNISETGNALNYQGETIGYVPVVGGNAPSTNQGVPFKISGTQISAGYSYGLGFDIGYSGVNSYHRATALPVRCLRSCSASPASPSSGTVIPSASQMIWSWNSVPGAAGYKWSMSNNFSTAIDMGLGLTRTETGLNCNTTYNRYVWAYNDCGFSIPLSLVQKTLACLTCGSTITISHVAGPVAPVTKTVSYGVVTNIPGETPKCWISRNLGASQQASSVTDNTEPSSGWYWQFNRKQGYKHDGSTRTPNTAWITGINESSDWSPANDPCTIELGSGWRLPTNTEWINVDAGGSWTNYNGPWNSGLKMHLSGYLSSTSGSVSGRGSYGYFWSSMRYNNTSSYNLYFTSSTCTVNSNSKTYGFAVRCLREPTPDVSIPTVITAPVSDITQSDALGGGAVTEHGGAIVSSRGICWSTSPNPTITGNHTVNGNGTGSFTSNLTGLSPNTTYYVRAYATNSAGTAYGTEISFATVYFACGEPFYDFRDGQTYSTKRIGSQCWMAQNLNIGAKINGSLEQTNPEFIEKYCYDDDDANCSDYGGLFQWNEVVQTSGYNTGVLFSESFEDGNGTTPPAGWSVIQVSGTIPGISFVTSSGSPTVTSPHDGNKFVKYSSFNITPGNTTLLKSPPISTLGKSSVNLDFAWYESLGYSSSYDKVYVQWSINGTSWSPAGDFIRYNSIPGWKVKNVALPAGAANQTELYIGFLFESQYGNNCYLDFVRVNYMVSRGICPAGWHLPSDGEWNVLTSFLGGETVAGGKMKEPGVLHWATPNTGADDSSGFAALPAGNRLAGGIFGNLLTDAGFWSSADTATGAWSRKLQHTSGAVTRYADHKSNGLSVRCIREITPTITTTPASSINQNSVMTGGNVTADGGDIVLVRGVCWSTSANPTVVDAHTSQGYGMGAFISNITGLIPGTTYYLRAYATNNIGTSYGEEISFVMLPPVEPVIITTQISNIYQSSAISGGNITFNGGLPVTARGLCWSTLPSPTLSGLHTIDGAGTGLFSSSLQGLSPATEYHVRAWATNAADTGYGNEIIFSTLSDSMCGSFITISHVAGLVAPVSKTVTYGMVSGIPGEPMKCWITRNLGADRQATTFRDSTEASAGWYWQFNRKQGYKHTGTTRTPNTAWIISIIENPDWQPDNDPCSVELGNSWRIPSSTEWYNVDASGNWTTWTGAWNSGLKLHAAGIISNESGELYNRDTVGYYWSSNQNNENYGSYLCFGDSYSFLSYHYKSTGMTLRCIKDSPYSVVPAVNTSAVTGVTQHLATAGGEVPNDGGALITARGVCWSQTPNPTILNSITTDGTGTGTFISNLTGLTPDTVYYLRAYATNNAGTGYGNEVTFRTLPVPVCGYSITVNHVAGTVDPVTKTVTYDIVSAIPGEPAKCWISRNLGASQQATAVSDASEGSAGWLWQFNRKQGYKIEGSVRTPNTTWITSISENMDWLAANDPCAIDLSGEWRIPTYTEWNNVDAGGNWSNWNSPWSSPLKIHAAGVTYNGILTLRGVSGWYWSSRQNSTIGGYYLNMESSTCTVATNNKSHGYSVRCIKDAPFALPATVTTDLVFNITQFTAILGGNVIADGGALVTERGVCWSTTPGPTIINDHMAVGYETGPFSVFVSGLTLNTQYFVRAYATSSAGTSYGDEVIFNTLAESPCGSSMTINHVAGNVAPVTKSVTYGIVTSIPGELPKCWITRNLGASQQATAVNDATEPSAGWYWQFNRKQGYKHDGTTRTPNTTWITSISENSDWLAANDPCITELGTLWRLPTSTEWTNVNTSGGWTNWNGPWNAALKMHAAGQLSYTSGALSGRGSSGFYYSSKSISTTTGISLYINSSSSTVGGYNYKASAFPVRCLRDCISLPASPAANGHVPSATQIIWKWTSVAGALGYKWNTINDCATATDMLTSITKTETGLFCDSVYTRYAWAYNTCGNSFPVLMNQTTLSCSACGAPITKNHLAGAVAPVNKTVVYGTVDNVPGEPSKCWITRNLGASQQATAATDTTEASAGWYWQFNRMQGFKHNGSTRTPNITWIDTFNENSDWVAANDPCAIELGNGWRLPTSSEWINADAAGEWTNNTGPWNSMLKLHAAGFLSTGGALTSKGYAGNYQSSTQSNGENGLALIFATSTSSVSMSSKGGGLPVRCIRDEGIVLSIPNVSTTNDIIFEQNIAH